MTAETETKASLTDTRSFAFLETTERETLDILEGGIKRLLLVHHRLVRAASTEAQATRGRPRGRPRLYMRPVFCSHLERPHYAKGLCSNCWHNESSRRRREVRRDPHASQPQH